MEHSSLVTVSYRTCWKSACWLALLLFSSLNFTLYIKFYCLCGCLCVYDGQISCLDSSEPSVYIILSVCHWGSTEPHITCLVHVTQHMDLNRTVYKSLLDPSLRAAPAPQSWCVRRSSASSWHVQWLLAALLSFWITGGPSCGSKPPHKWLTCPYRMASWLPTPGTSSTARVFTGWWSLPQTRLWDPWGQMPQTVQSGDCHCSWDGC